MFKRLSRAGLKLKVMKFFLSQKRVSYPKRVVTEEGIATDPVKVEQVCMWPTLGNSMEVRSFLRLASYYR